LPPATSSQEKIKPVKKATNLKLRINVILPNKWAH
jgi:hypothetical protein